MKKLLVGTLVLLTIGCATTGSQQEEAEPVIPVFEYAESVPCEYEELQFVQHRMTLIPRSGDHYDAVRDRELAKLGAAIGADAVIVAERHPDRPLSITIETPMNALFEGMAIRYLDEDCRVRSRIRT